MFSRAKAASFPAENVSVETSMSVGGSNDNLIRVVKGQGATFQVTLKLVSPPSGIVLGTDTLDTKATVFANRPILSFGAGLDIVGSENSCKTAGITNIVGSQTFAYCPFDTGGVKKDYLAKPNNVSAGQGYSQTFNLSASQVDALTKSRPCSDNKGASITASCFAIYPYMDLDIAGSFTQKNITFTNASTYMYVQYFNDQASLNTAVSNNDRGGAPAYGSRTGNAQVAGQGSPVLGFINQVIGGLLGLIQEFIFLVFYWLIAPIIQAMLSVRTYTDTFVGIIYPGWIIVRNICNILFIISIIAIGLGTLFRIESYQYKHLLVQLIIAALLVNFSLVIAQAILGLADTIQSQFLPNNVEVIRALAKDLMVGYRSVVYNVDFASQGDFANTIQPLFFLGLSLGSFLVFGAVAAYLVIRIVALWVLLLISPIAYVAGVLPVTAKYRSVWWSNFIKYAFFTPIMAFFLNITAVMLSVQKDNPVLKTLVGDPSSIGGSDLANFVVKVASNILILVFLIAAIKVADQMGIFGAHAISDIAQKGVFAPFGAAGGLAKVGEHYVGRKWNEWTSSSKIRGHEEKVSFGRAAAFAVLNPKSFIKGMKKQSEERIHRAQAKAESTGLEMAEQRFSSPRAIFKGSYKINPHVLQHEKEEEDEQAKKLQNLSRAEVARRIHQIAMMGDTEEDMAYKRGSYKLAMSKGYIDDAVGETSNTKEGQFVIDKMLKNKWLHTDDYDTSDLVNKNNGNKIIQNPDGTFSEKDMITGTVTSVDRSEVGLVPNSHSTRRAFQLAMFGGKLTRTYVDSATGERYTGDKRNAADEAVEETYSIKDHAAARLITQEGESEAKSTGHLQFMTDMETEPGTGHYAAYALRKVKDDVTGKVMWVSDGEKRMAASELAKFEGRRSAQIAWHSLVSSDGQNFSKAIFAVWAKGVKDNPGFVQERMANFLITGHASASDDEVAKNSKKIKEDIKAGKTDLEIRLSNPNFAKNVKMMWEIDKDAARILLQKFSGVKDLSKNTFTFKDQSGNMLKDDLGNNIELKD